MNAIAEDEAKKVKRAEKKLRQKKRKEVSEQFQESSDVVHEELNDSADNTEVNVTVANQFSCLDLHLHDSKR